MHLLAAQLNFAAGAETCQEALDAALDAETLLVSISFDGTGSYLGPKGSTKNAYYDALDLAEILDQYNNGLLCGDGGPYEPPVTGTGSMHIGSLTAATSSGKGDRWNAEVTVTVHDETETTLANATVSGSWSGSGKGTGSCVTDGFGQCTITKSNVRGDSVTFTVTEVSLAGYTYNDGDNDDDSITVNKP
jgi:hypothetical protein